MSYNNNYKPSEMADAIREIIRVGQETDLCPTSRSLTVILQAVNAKTLSISETMVPGALKGRWILIGGVKRQVINNSTSGIVLNEAIESAAIGTKIYPCEDGENPNYVKTIAGTLANPWGDITPSELVTALASNYASASLQITVNGVTVTVNPVITNYYLIFSMAAYNFYSSDWSVIASAAYVVSNGALLYAYYKRDNALLDLKQTADSVTTMLTIIHHPLPDTP